MSARCERLVAEVGNGIGASLRGVDCMASEMTATAFSRLFGSDGAMVPALTILLTLFVAFFAFQLLTGRSRIGINALTPRFMTLGLVLTFATSWMAYQSVVWNLATGAPEEIATVLTGTDGPATQVFADKIDVLFLSVANVAETAAGGEAPSSIASPEGMLWLGATLFLLGTVGVLVTAKIALAVLVAIGPVFVVMALFPGTRGLFVGWLRGLVLLAVVPLFAVLGGSLMLELSVPVLSALNSNPSAIDPRAAMAFFMIGAVHAALMVLVLKTAATMVGGWNVFGLADQADRDKGADTKTSDHPAQQPQAAAQPNRANQTAVAAQQASAGPRRIDISAQPVHSAANDAGSAGNRVTNIVTQGGGSTPTSANASLSRARGIGSRFRQARHATSEKLK